MQVLRFPRHRSRFGKALKSTDLYLSGITQKEINPIGFHQRWRVKVYPIEVDLKQP